MSYDPRDTIVALATAPAPAARAVVRIAGPDVVRVLESCFLPTGGTALGSVRGAGVIEGRFQLATLQRELPCELLLWPDERSYTRSPLAEIHLLGSVPLAEAVIRTLCQSGCRLAGPGEFTLRAFLGGRLDLTQAEAVWGVVQATDEAQLDVALRQLAGGLSTPLVRLRDQLLHLVAHLEAGLDFVDEEIEFIAPAELRQQLQAAAEEVSQLVAQMRGRSEVPTAPRVVLTGAANVGKSSLFNALLEKQGALVSQRAGTTRDYLTATLELDGATCQLVDTAGFAELAGEPTDAIASQSQAAAAGQLRAADVELLCRELSHGPPTPPTKPLPPGVTPPRIIVLTKRDLGPPIPAEGLNREGLLPVVAVSSHTGEGLDELRQVLRTVIQQTRRSDDVYVSATVTRCQEALRRAATYLEAARSAAAAGTGEEIVAAEIRQALDELGEVVGAVYTDDILDRIFSRFCIGK